MDDFSKLIQNSEKLLELPGGHKGLILKPDMANYGLSLLRNRFDFIQLISINKVTKKQFSELIRSEYLMYHVSNPYKNQQIFVFIPLIEGRKVNSTTSHWKNSHWYERQIHENYGTSFKNSFSNWKMFEVTENPQEKHFNNVSRENYQLKKLKWKKVENSHKYSFVGKDLFFKKRGGKILQGYIQIGQNRKKREDLYVTGSLFHSLKDFSLSAQVNYLFSLKLGLEKFKGVTPSERHQVVCMIALESHRILDHLKACSLLLSKNKITSPYRSFQKTYAYFKQFFTPGEYDFDFERHLGYIEDNLNSLIQHLIDIQKMLKFEENYSLLKRRISFGEYKKKDLIEYGVTGVLAKSCGLRIDSRKLDPFYFYKEMEFEVPLGSQGSLYEQFMIRQSEIKESIQIILKLFDNLPVKRKVKEHTLQHLLQDCPGLLIGHNIEKSNGLCNLTLLSQGNKKERLLVRSPDFNQTQFLSSNLKGLSPFQVHQMGKGLGLNPLEIDR